MRVVGPSGRAAILPAVAGLTYPGWAYAVSRATFDAHLRDAALAAGAEPLHARLVHLKSVQPGAISAQLAGGGRLDADVIIGADGARSSVASSVGLVDPQRSLWAFAVRRYVDANVDLPTIVLWEPRRWRLFPGYGWVFPAQHDGANVGLGWSVSPNRGNRDSREKRAGVLDAFTVHLQRLGILPDHCLHGPITGGWLKLGGVGTSPAQGGVLLIGDAAGLVNPLQGEGIAQAMASGEAAARAVIAGGPAGAAALYRNWVAAFTNRHRRHVPIHRVTVRHTSTVSLTSRVLTLPGVGTMVGGAWGLYWNDLVDGAAPSRHRALAYSMDKFM
jgi:flavin-dependent dehydrogenase